jgi:hypothetical protein
MVKHCYAVMIIDDRVRKASAKVKREEESRVDAVKGPVEGSSGTSTCSGTFPNFGHLSSLLIGVTETGCRSLPGGFLLAGDRDVQQLLSWLNSYVRGSRQIASICLLVSTFGKGKCPWIE